jgi:hypothetical protein
MPTADHPLASFLTDTGFHASAMGFQMRKAAGSSTAFGSDSPALAVAQGSLEQDDDA